MSELTPCNYCTYLRMKRRATSDRKIVTKVASGTGVDIYVHPESVTIDPHSLSHRRRYWRCWFMELGKECAC
jgi:hypothetical protein